MDRLRHLTLALLLAIVALGCEEKPKADAPARFAGVQKAATAKAASFCDKSWSGGKGPAFALPATRPLANEAARTVAKGWRWVNVWATWCRPCVEEMGLLGRWKDAFSRDGADVAFELLSIDEEANQEALLKWRDKNLPGPIRWIKSEADFPPWLDTLEVDRAAAIPIHALIDPAGKLRCVRVGAIHDQDYGAVRALISSAQ